ncbi:MULTISPECIES: hypothetical protein [unclassified Sphingopyxis]|uniref:hypothetical protein n=1 Tax=unclassified Sphingopyxis TaxID=2614943 RepID=UPI00285600EF|nr:MULTISPECIES: hypothetical protein [unclassified Sphingopyxis]MDR6832699.1 hypothetical protein [Sphingopyxis sp. BE122]MDR7228442.1 hypothetical protein [Sphingopyxis sp. BE259]
MAGQNHRMIVIGRLKAKPLLAGQLLCALAAAALIAWQAVPVWSDGAAAMLRAILFGNLLVSAGILLAVLGFAAFHRAWRRRDAFIWHDGARLYRGARESWPLPLIRDVVIARSELGIASLRLVVDDDSEVTRELVKLYLLEDAPEAVRGGVMFAVAGLRGFPSGSVLN